MTSSTLQATDWLHRRDSLRILARQTKQILYLQELALIKSTVVVVTIK